MPRKKPDIFYIYKTTNLINNKFYVGKHCTIKIENDYLGSGKRLRYSIRKYGKENFKKEILEFCNDPKHLAEREKLIVNEELLKNSLCMNLKIGGDGGWYAAQEERLRKIKTDTNFHLFWKNKVSNGVLKSYQKGRKINLPNWSGKEHKEETKLKMSNSHKGKGLKESNSQYGTMWITNGSENKKIKVSDIIPKGYYKGRK